MQRKSNEFAFVDSGSSNNHPSSGPKLQSHHSLDNDQGRRGSSELKLRSIHSFDRGHPRQPLNGQHSAQLGNSQNHGGMLKQHHGGKQDYGGGQLQSGNQQHGGHQQHQQQVLNQKKSLGQKQQSNSKQQSNASCQNKTTKNSTGAKMIGGKKR